MNRTLHLAVFDGAADWEYGYVTAAVNASPNRTDPAWAVRTVGLTGDSVTTMGGLRVTPDLTLDQVRPQDSAMLLLPGGDWTQPRLGPFVELARSFLEQDVPVAAICAATFALAGAGLLDDRRHTSNAREYLAASGYAGGAHYVDEPAVVDGPLITASGLAPLPFAAEILALLGVFPSAVVEAWRRLNETRDPKDFYALQEAAARSGGTAGADA